MTHRTRILAAVDSLCADLPAYGPAQRQRKELLNAIDEALKQAEANAIVSQWPVFRRATELMERAK